MNHQGTKTPRGEVSSETDAVAAQVVDSGFAVHKGLGPGLLESVYELCLAHEMTKRGLEVQRQVELPIVYDGMRLDAGLRLDFVVSRCLVVELKAVESILPVHVAQVLTYLKLSGHRLGFLINFNVTLFKNGIRRIAL